jgi:hypothetical protein
MRKQINRCLVFTALLPMLLSACSQSTPGTAPSEASPAPSYQIVDGYAIKTDYSGLKPYEPPAEKYTRLSEGPLPELKPADNYGTLLPYAGETLYGEGGWSVSSLYGFVTKDAKIVTDPVYTSVWQGYYYNPGTASGTYVPAYHLQKLTDTIDRDDPWNNIRHGACALDGSWITPVDFADVYFFDNVIVCVRDFNTNDADIMDYSGKLLYNTKSLSCYQQMPQKSAYMFQSGYGEGRFALTLSGGKSAYVDALTGTVTELKYDECAAFFDGLAAVKKDGLYGYIDKSLNLVIQPRYTSAEYFNKGKSVVQNADGSYALIDRTGMVLLKNNGYISRWDSSTYGLYDGDNTPRYYDDTLKEIKQGDAPADPLYDGWFSYKTADGIVVFKGSESLLLPGYSGVGYIRGSLMSVYKSDGDVWEEGLLTTEGKELIPPAQNQSITIAVSEVTGKQYAIVSGYEDGSQTFKVYDGEGNFLFGGLGWANFLPQFDLFDIRSDFSSSYMDVSGNTLFRISLMAYVPD